MEQPRTPKRKTKRLESSSTPDRKADVTLPSRNIDIRKRATMAPSDFMQNQTFRKPISSKSSLAPDFFDNVKKVELEKDTELGSVYEKYLQALATELIMKRKVEEESKSMISQLASITKERDLVEDKLCKIKLRQMDVNYLSKAQNELDAQISDLSELTDVVKNKYPVKKTLQKLKTVLEPIDALRCKNIVLPESLEKWKEANEKLKETQTKLETIKELIGKKNESLQDVTTGVNELLETSSEIEKTRKTLEDTLTATQILVLKDASNELQMINND
ncbi:uncharacterized protein LOC105699057 [Orussus abietinus]|uniref:uncharacterized protein LOC105699057 n=1 Tax=Orussus abietinus TaxID=222816 RepID=UPI0006261165|nr:uncharacterized protein LOC105699057 [Orussus abietinus]XP_012279182.1 uncharacterized protein LOC105699057 [Orussus abietinus]